MNPGKLPKPLLLFHSLSTAFSFSLYIAMWPFFLVIVELTLVFVFLQKYTAIYVYIMMSSEPESEVHFLHLGFYLRRWNFEEEGERLWNFGNRVKSYLGWNRDLLEKITLCVLLVNATMCLNSMYLSFTSVQIRWNCDCY